MSWSPDNEENPFGDPSIDEARKSNITSTGSPRDSSMNANHTPSWIEDAPPSNSKPSSSSYTPPPSSFPTETANTRDSQMRNNSQDQNINQQNSGEAPGLVVYMRVANLVSSIILITFSVLALISAFNFTGVVICCYLICFSCLLCCFEMRIRQISNVINKNFGFMFSWQSRTTFLLFVAILCFGVNGSATSKGLMTSSGILMLCIAFFNAYVLYKYPQFSTSRPIDYKKAATGAAIDYAKNNPDVVQAGVKAGIDHAKNNPEHVKQGVDSWI